jgi:hypothetical protein
MGDNYWIIDQVKHGTYKSYFRDDVAIDFVLLTAMVVGRRQLSSRMDKSKKC